MPRTIATLSLCVPLLLAAGAARAQDAAAPAGNCPQLPPNAGLAWEAQSSAAGDFCRALFEDGSEAFGLYITPERNFDPVRRNRAERGYTIDGHEVTWYRAEIASKPGVEARETNIELADGRYVHIWLQSPSPTELAARLQLVGRLHFAGAGIAD
jgi:hypothetical protein